MVSAQCQLVALAAMPGRHACPLPSPPADLPSTIPPCSEDPNCNLCTQDGVCTQCFLGFGLGSDRKTCEACADPNCSSCNDDSQTCDEW